MKDSDVQKVQRFSGKKSKILREVITRWCFQTCFFSPLPGEMMQFDDHIFQRGWFNHQLDKVDGPRKLWLSSCGWYITYTQKTNIFPPWEKLQNHRFRECLSWSSQEGIYVYTYSVEDFPV